MLQATDDVTDKPADSAAPPPLRLTKLRREAAQLLKNQIKIGAAIRAQRIVYVQDLDTARGEKQEWVTRTTDLLKQLFSDGTVAEQCNDWVGPILPEYADFNLFVEQFGIEMRHRIGRLQGLVKHLDQYPEPMRSSSSTRGDVKMVAQVAMPTEAEAPIVRAPPPAPARSNPAGVLILRSADESLHTTVAQFVAKLDLALHMIDQRPAEGRVPLAQALSQHERATFALILNDAPAADGDYLFDLGCCAGRFSASRLCVLQREGASQEDVRGVRHISIDAAGGWQLLLARHLKAGGVSVDLNRLV